MRDRTYFLAEINTTIQSHAAALPGRRLTSDWRSLDQVTRVCVHRFGLITIITTAAISLFSTVTSIIFVYKSNNQDICPCLHLQMSHRHLAPSRQQIQYCSTIHAYMLCINLHIHMGRILYEVKTLIRVDLYSDIYGK